MKLTSALRAWAENTLISLKAHTPADFVLPLMMDKITGKPVPPGGSLRSQVAVLGAHNAYNGVVPPSWAHDGGYPKGGSKKSSVIGHDCSLGVSSGSQLSFGFWENAEGVWGHE